MGNLAENGEVLGDRVKYSALHGEPSQPQGRPAASPATPPPERMLGCDQEWMSNSVRIVSHVAFARVARSDHGTINSHGQAGEGVQKCPSLTLPARWGVQRLRLRFSLVWPVRE